MRDKLFYNSILFSIILSHNIHAQVIDDVESCRTNISYIELFRVGDVTSGNCSDVVNVTGIILESTLYTGLGSDHINIGRLLRSSVLTGNGNNSIALSTTAYDSDIVSGSGFDVVFIGGDITRLNLDTGDSADNIIINGDVYEGKLLTGSGNDNLNISSIDFVRGYIDMGEGQDTLVLSGAYQDYIIEYNDGFYTLNDYNQTYIHNVESIVFSDGILLVDGIELQPISP